MCYTNKRFSVDVDQSVTSFKPSVLEEKKTTLDVLICFLKRVGLAMKVVCCDIVYTKMQVLTGDCKDTEFKM